MPDIFEKASAAPDTGPALMTKLGMIEGEILARLEAAGHVTAQELVRQLPWSAESMLMAIGSLIRQGLVRGEQTSSGLDLEPVHDQDAAAPVWD